MNMMVYSLKCDLPLKKRASERVFCTSVVLRFALQWISSEPLFPLIRTSVDYLRTFAPTSVEFNIFGVPTSVEFNITGVPTSVDSEITWVHTSVGSEITNFPISVDC